MMMRELVRSRRSKIKKVFLNNLINNKNKNKTVKRKRAEKKNHTNNKLLLCFNG